MDRRRSLDMCEREHLRLAWGRMVGGFLIGFGWLWLAIWIGERA